MRRLREICQGFPTWNNNHVDDGSTYSHVSRGACPCSVGERSLIVGVCVNEVQYAFSSC